MATEEREWLLSFAPSGLDGEDFAVYAITYESPRQADDGTEVVPKARVEAAEQHVRELREMREKDLDHCRMLDRDLTKALEKAGAAEAKLATAVEALKDAIETMRELRAYTPEWAVEKWVYDEEIAKTERALSEIEQGDQA